MKKMKMLLPALILGVIFFTALGMPEEVRASGIRPAQTNEKALLDIPDADFRKYIVEKLLEPGRAPIPSDAETPPPGYTDPVYGSDLTKIEGIEKIELKTWTLPSNKNIKTVEGLAYFKNLKSFDMQDISVNRIDFTGNKGIETIRLSRCGLQGGIDLTGLTRLENLQLSANEYEQLDVGTNTGLKKFQSTGPSTDKTKGIRSIDLRANTALEEVNVSMNPLEELDLSGNPGLKEVLFTWTDLRRLELTDFPLLEKVVGESGSLEEAYISRNPLLKSVSLNNAPVTVLELKENPELKSLSLNRLTNMKTLDLKDLKKLKKLEIDQSVIETLDLSRNTELKEVKAFSAKLEELDLSGLTKLEKVDLRNNLLKTVTLNRNGKLDDIKVSGNQLKTLDVQSAPALRYIECENNQIETLDTSALALNRIKCGNNRLAVLDLKASRIDSHYYADISGQAVTVQGKAEGNVLAVNMKELAGKANFSSVVSVEAESYDPGTGKVTVGAGNPKFRYVYRAASKKNYKQEDVFLDMGVEVTVVPSGGSPGGGGAGSSGGGSGSAGKAPERPVKEEPKTGSETKRYIDGYADGSFRPDEKITRAEAAKLLAYALKNFDGTKPYAGRFSDVSKDSWYGSVVGYIEELGAVSGYSDGTFRPDGRITRAEFSVIIARMKAYQEMGGNAGFSDLEGHWAGKYVKFAEEKGWISGYGDGSFRPDAEITRAEAVKIINNVLGIKPDKNRMDQSAEQYRQFSDLPKNHWAYYDITAAARK